MPREVIVGRRPDGFGPQMWWPFVICRSSLNFLQVRQHLRLPESLFCGRYMRKSSSSRRFGHPVGFFANLMLEPVERTFAQVCETGGGRRAWLRGWSTCRKGHLLRCCAYSLGLVTRKCFGMGKPRSGAALLGLILVLAAALGGLGSVGSNPARKTCQG